MKIKTNIKLENHTVKKIDTNEIFAEANSSDFIENIIHSCAIKLNVKNNALLINDKLDTQQCFSLNNIQYIEKSDNVNEILLPEIQENNFEKLDNGKKILLSKFDDSQLLCTDHIDHTETIPAYSNQKMFSFQNNNNLSLNKEEKKI